MTVELGSKYLGLVLRSPIVASASPLTKAPETARLLDAAGVGAIVLPSIFEEEILREDLDFNDSLEGRVEHFAEALEYFPDTDTWKGAFDRYVARLEAVKASVSVPVIASLNGTTAGGWVKYAERLQAAGASALELNLYHLVADPNLTGQALEDRDIELIGAVREAVSIPLSVKLSPYYSAFANFAARVVATKVDGLVLFNRFYQPDLDLDTLEVVNRLELSASWELRLPLRWIAILRAQVGDAVSLAATSGVHSGRDVAKAILVGADVAQVASVLLRHGPDQVRVIEAELRAWMGEHEYESVDEMRGAASAASIEDPSTFERANYMQTLRSWTPAARAAR